MSTGLSGDMLCDAVLHGGLIHDSSTQVLTCSTASVWGSTVPDSSSEPQGASQMEVNSAVSRGALALSLM